MAAAGLGLWAIAATLANPPDENLVVAATSNESEIGREPDQVVSSTTTELAPTTSPAARPRASHDPSNLEPWTAEPPTALQLEMTENGVREHADGSEGRTIWIPVDRVGIPDFGSSSERVLFSDRYFEQDVLCEQNGFAIVWQENGFELIRPALSPTGGRLPTSLISFECPEDQPLGIVELPAQSGDFVKITRIDDEHYELSSNDWKLTIKRQTA